MTEPMKTLEQLQQDWGNSTCSKEPEQYIYDYMKNQVEAEREKVKYIIKQMISDASSWTNEELYEIIDSL